MFDNIGGKIKGLAKTLFWLETIAAVIVGLVLAEDTDGLSFLYAIAGVLVAWISAWFLYGFGQLIENSDIIAEEYKRTNEKHEKAAEKNNICKQERHQKKIKATMANPNVDEDEYIDIICANCKAELSYTKGQLRSGEGLTCPVCDTPISL